jgi:uncharacterized protein (DUF169 family)
MMTDWKELDRGLRKYVNPATHPVAVKFLDDETQIPPRARRPFRDLNLTLAPCQGAAMTRRYGWSVAFTKEDVGCAIAAHTYGWERVGDTSGAVHFLTEMNYAADRETAERMFKAFPALDTNREPVVLFYPLKNAEMDPDVILIYVNPAQCMRLIHGATYNTGKPLLSSFSGRAASCSEGIIGAFQEGSVKIVVPGNGDRVWASCQDHEMLMAAAAHHLEPIVLGLEKTHQTGIRYPIPTYMGYAPEVGLTVPLSDVFKPEELQKLFKKKG